VHALPFSTALSIFATAQIVLNYRLKYALRRSWIFDVVVEFSSDVSDWYEANGLLYKRLPI